MIYKLVFKIQLHNKKLAEKNDQHMIIHESISKLLQTFCLK